MAKPAPNATPHGPRPAGAEARSAQPAELAYERDHMPTQRIDPAQLPLEPSGMAPASAITDYAAVRPAPRPGLPPATSALLGSTVGLFIGFVVLLAVYVFQTPLPPGQAPSAAAALIAPARAASTPAAKATRSSSSDTTEAGTGKPKPQLVCRPTLEPVRMGMVHSTAPPPTLRFDAHQLHLGYVTPNRVGVGATWNLTARRIERNVLSHNAYSVSPRSTRPVAWAVDESARHDTPHRLLPELEQRFVALADRIVEVDSDKQRLLWQGVELAAGDNLHAAPVGDKLLLALRSGGRAGSVRVGWWSEAAGALGAMAPLPTNSIRQSAPALAASAEQAFIATADRARHSRWVIHLHSAKPEQAAVWRGALQRPASVFAPALAVLDRERLVLQWREGDNGDAKLMAQVFDHGLRPRSKPIVLADHAPLHIKSGAIAVDGTRVASVFYQLRGGHSELWATLFDCR